jgi:hypothetical protein
MSSDGGMESHELFVFQRMADALDRIAESLDGGEALKAVKELARSRRACWVVVRSEKRGYCIVPARCISIPIRGEHTCACTQTVELLTDGTSLDVPVKDVLVTELAAEVRCRELRDEAARRAGLDS